MAWPNTRGIINMLAGPKPPEGNRGILQTLQPRQQTRQQPTGYGGLAQAMQPLAAPVLSAPVRQEDPAARMQKIAAMLAYREGVSGGGGGDVAPQDGGVPAGGSMADIMDAILGSPVPGQRPHASTHATSGLSGYPAYDYMAPAGTPTVAPVGGRITRLSGRDPSQGGSPGGPLGYSIYLQGKDGRSYFLTHLDRVGVKVGQRVRQGQRIAQVAAGPASWSSPHVHQGVRG